MDKSWLEKILAQVQSGKFSVEKATEQLKNFPLENLEFARIDHHRALRRGQPEVIYAPGKTDQQIIKIAGRINKSGCDAIITRLEESRFKAIKKSLKKAVCFADARMVLILGGRKKKPKKQTDTTVLVCCGGTSDIPVAEEAALTAWIMGCPVDRLYDVGVAGIHRLFSETDRIKKAGVLIVAAGMEGALPSVIGGLVDKPVIAVPTSIGYGASFGGLAALLGMLNSCASGVTVVNIDNGFGAGIAASLIARSISKVEK
ncbi:MAG TPA: nickel pincer cofactor biosynthesis protein LarB [candidate division Zixibacteria bacterium]|nr:nickel pincer cofactor biosynthesis protein LarB [candidate division Zixibacteria bacterium]